VKPLLLVLALATSLPVQSCTRHDERTAANAIDKMIRTLAKGPHADPTVTVLPEAVRGAVSGTAVVPDGTVGDIEFGLVSSTWTTLTGAASVTVNGSIDRSLDGGATWQPVSSWGWQSPGLNSKNGTMPGSGVTLDGSVCAPLSCVWRMTLVPSGAFAYGLTATY
jgi:hypothetical protein